VREPGPLVNRSVWLTTAVLGMTYAVAGAHHGAFETLQGNTTTPGLFIASIGPEHVRWEYGTDGAFTLIPNFLATGIAAILVSLAIIVWCLFCLPRRSGAAVFLALFVLLTAVGGGIGHTVFFLSAWAYATRMRRSLAWWDRVLGPAPRRLLSRTWATALASSSLLFLLALEISVFGWVPGTDDPERIMAVVWGVLLASLVSAHVAFVGAIARDLRSPQRHAAVGAAA
jgi:hypothetical protein